MRLSDLDIEDYHDLVNALKDGPSVPAEVSYHIQWHGVKRVDRVHDATNHFSGRFIEDSATVEWSASEHGFRFKSDPASTTVTEFAEIGEERNGLFFSDDD